ncbi:unnamed protein product [Diatraea saccharalis]|uniref:Uncharacterized protein n=1 Tax=Diatraea saccharalis TaxID=40085 RepID=A0A9N9RGE1_9NEOP|nr:unnamed protein product [Diatraea saccharalis]
MNASAVEPLSGKSDGIATQEIVDEKSRSEGASSATITDADQDKSVIDVDVNENLLKDLKKKSADDQKNLKKTGGGSFTPTLTDVDHQILSVLDAQIRPDVNPYDDAADYFGDNVEENSLPEHNPQPQPNPQPQSNPQPQPNLPKTNRKRKLVLQRKNDKAVLINKHPAEALKKIYFKKKIELAYYQKKNEMQRFRFEQKKHELEMQILKKQLEKANKDLA